MTSILQRCVSVIKEKEFVLYGLDAFDQILKEVADCIKGALNDFDLQLILSEALSNAFIHGNQRDKAKPIYLRLKLKNSIIEFEIEDTGTSPATFKIPDEITDENILNDHGRGLFLLKCFTDSIDFKNNKLILTKAVSFKK